MYAATLSDVRAAAERIKGKAHQTPVLTCGTLDRLAGRRLFFKCEQLQKVGAFKFRGACNALFSLGEAEAARGVLTHSSGNHAQALALAARMRGVAAHIVMPDNASPVKRRAVEEYGGRVVSCRPTLEARETTAARVARETGATFIHPYDDPRIIAGQGTAALELLAQVEGLDAIIAPVGGGGLLSGTCVAARGIDPRVRLFAGEPQGADDAARSLAAGRLIPQTAPDTLADGLLTSLGQLTWPIIRDHVEQVITVSDSEIVAAMRLAWERAKLLVEPSSAVALAAVLSTVFTALPGMERVGIILSGGNVELENLPWADDTIEMPIDGTLDLHTFHPREVKDLVPEYLKACREKGILEVRVIHGKGTGVLRRTVESVLERMPWVISWQLATNDRSGWGATVVRLAPLS